jgi:hypothetical protein
MADDVPLAEAVRAALAKAGPVPAAPGAAPPAHHRRLPGFLAFAGAVLGAAAAVYQRADALGLTLSAGVFAVIFFLMGLRLTRRMHPNQAALWASDARRYALAAAVEALQATGRLAASDRLAADSVEAPTLDLRLPAEAGAAPPTAAGYLEEALAGRAAGVSYALGTVDHTEEGAAATSDMRGLLLQIDVGSGKNGSALMTWEAGALADAAHDWFARTHLKAREGRAPDGVAGVRVQTSGGAAAAFEGAPREFLDALGRHLSERERPPFLLATVDRRLLLYIQGEGPLTGPEDALRHALARAQSDPTALEGPALAAAEAILPLHRLVATLGASSALPET